MAGAWKKKLLADFPVCSFDDVANVLDQIATRDDGDKILRACLADLAKCPEAKLNSHKSLSVLMSALLRFGLRQEAQVVDGAIRSESRREPITTADATSYFFRLIRGVRKRHCVRVDELDELARYIARSALDTSFWLGISTKLSLSIAPKLSSSAAQSPDVEPLLDVILEILCSTVGDQASSFASTQGVLGYWLVSKGQFRDAKPQLVSAMTVLEHNGDSPAMLAVTRLNLGCVHFAESSLEEAESCFQLAAQTFIELGEFWEIDYLISCRNSLVARSKRASLSPDEQFSDFCRKLETQMSNKDPRYATIWDCDIVLSGLPTMAA